jgi:hypothetical protein
MHYVLVLVLFIFFVTLVLWWFFVLEYVGGMAARLVAGVASFLAMFFGIRIDFFRRQRVRFRELLEETVQFVQNEIDVVYHGKMDSSGRIFASYCNLFRLAAVAMDVDVEAFHQKLLRLRVGRRCAGLRMPGLIQKLTIDMTYNSNAKTQSPSGRRQSF